MQVVIHQYQQHEEIDVPSLFKEVVSFLGKEAEYRNIRIVDLSK